MKRERTVNWQRWTPVAFFGLCFLRFCYYGFTYLPMLDDSIQYHNYATYGDGLISEINRMGLLAARPLAGVMDIAFWSHFFGCLMAAVLLITILFTLAAWLFERALRPAFGCGPIFYAVLLLTPLNFEGVYWLSAASRVVVGMFFCALGAFFFSRYAQRGRWRDLPLFMLFSLIACGFYEQSLVLTVAVTFVLAVGNWRRLHARALWGLLAVVNVGIYFGFTGIFKNSALYAGRTSGFILPFSSDFYNEMVWPVFVEQIDLAFVKAPILIHLKGFVRGLKLIVEQPNFWYLALTVVLTLFIALSPFWTRRIGVRKKVALTEQAEDAPARNAAEGDSGSLEREADPQRPERDARRPHIRRIPPAKEAGLRGILLGLAAGLILAVAPIAPFVVLATPWISLRGVVSCLPGIALFADRLVALILWKVPPRRGITSGLTAALCLFFMVGSVSEIHDYQQTMRDDQRIVGQIVELIGDRRPTDDWTRTIMVIGLRPSYLKEVNFQHNEHIHGVTESDWAMTGAACCQAGSVDFPTPVPLRYGDVTEREEDIDKAFALLYADENGDIHPAEREGDSFTVDGREVARLERGDRLMLVEVEQ